MISVGVRLWGVLALASLTIAGVPLPGKAGVLEPLQIITAGKTHEFQVEIAADDANREHGLMNRRYMPADRGMLFEFEREAVVSFWMKNTYIPLDMVFISRAGIVTNVVADAEPLSERVIPSGPPCAAVLELNGGAAAAIGLKVGDRVRHPFFKS
jgi:uncharacterized protein